LRTIHSILRGIDHIAFVQLTSADVVRHSLVGKIVEAYNTYSQNGRKAKNER
jgi:phosphate starvation-inducible PhoH-like protein